MEVERDFMRGEKSSVKDKIREWKGEKGKEL